MIVKLKKVADIKISSVDKKFKKDEKPVKLCNYVDVYKNTNIYSCLELMDATATQKEISGLRLRKNDVLITKDSETANDIGMSACVATDFMDNIVVLGYHVALIRPKDGLDGKYLNYLLHCDFERKYMENNASGSGQRVSLSQATLDNIPVLLKDLSQQKLISDILFKFDQLVKINQVVIDLASLTIKQLYNYWFVQFDFPDENGRPYKSSGGKMVYNERLKQEVPEGWKVSDLANTNLATVIKPGIDNFVGEKAYLATGNVNGNNISDKAKSITYANRESRANMQPTCNSVWFAKMKDSVKHIIATDNSSDLVNHCVFSTGFCGLQASKTSLCYLAAYISQPQFEQAKNMLAHGATQKAISNSDLAGIAILEPDDITLQKFASIVYPILELIDNCRQQSKQLTSLRDWLLPMLMNGQVEINDDEQ